MIKKRRVKYFAVLFFISACSGPKSSDSTSDSGILIHHHPSDIRNPLGAQLWDTAVSYADAGNFSRAKVYLERCNELESANPQVLNALGVSYLAMGDSVAALEYYAASIAADSLALEGYASAGCLLQIQKKYPESVRILKLGLSKGDKSQFTYFNLCLNIAVSYYYQDSCARAKEFIALAKSHGFDNTTFDERLLPVEREIYSYCR